MPLPRKISAAYNAFSYVFWDRVSSQIISSGIRFSRKTLPRADELLGAGGDYVTIEYRSPHDGTKVRQRWSLSDMRWPAETITEHRRSYRRKAG